MSAAVSILRRPLTLGFLRDGAYLLLGGVTGTLLFTVVVTTLSTVAGLLVLIVGIPIGIAAIYLHRWLCDIDRQRVRLLGDAPIGRPYRRRREGEGLLRWWMSMIADRTTWRDVVWMIAGFPVTLAGFVVAAAAAGILSVITLPLWAWALPAGSDLYGGLFGDGGGFDAAVLWAIPVGLALSVPAAWLVRGATELEVRMARALLGPWREGELTERIDTLTETRQGAVEAAVGELQRVERDLHDGAQARLVALSIDLGMADQKLAGGDDEAARRHLAEARGQATTAMSELRDLVRGIGPSILRDRGLEAALTAVAAGRTPPVRVAVDLPSGEPDAAQTALYFVCVEAVVNASKHAHARRIDVRVWRDAAERLVAEITDDGVGGADVSHGTGLEGLAKRLAALDGTLLVNSPEGGPTTIRAEV
jgi:signal transduction histidine kinase